MKKVLFLIAGALLLAGCSQPGYFQHDTMYKNWDHMKFSWYGYNNPSEDVAEKSMEQDWWGYDVPYVPGQ